MNIAATTYLRQPVLERLPVAESGKRPADGAVATVAAAAATPAEEAIVAGAQGLVTGSKWFLLFLGFTRRVW